MTASSASPGGPVAPEDGPPVDGLDRGHLNRNQLVALALASYVPPVGLASVPALGAAAMAWMYLNGLVNPPAPPLDAMSYVAVVAVAVVFVAFLAVDRLARARRTASHQTHH